MPVMRLQLITITLQQALPVEVVWNRRRLIERRSALLIRHLEEEQKRQLLDIIPVRQPVIAQDVAVIPEFLNELMRLFNHAENATVYRRLIETTTDYRTSEKPSRCDFVSRTRASDHFRCLCSCKMCRKLDE